MKEKPDAMLNRRQVLQGVLASLAALTLSESESKASDKEYVPTQEDLRISEIMKSEVKKLREYEDETANLTERLSTMTLELTKVFLPNSEEERQRKDALVVEYKNIRSDVENTKGRIEKDKVTALSHELPPSSREYLESEYARMVRRLDSLRNIYILINTML